MSSKSSGHIPVVDVDQAFPTLVGTTVGSSSVSPLDQGPTVQSAIRDVLGVRTRVADPKAFTDALTASFRLTVVEGHVESDYVPRGYAIQSDLGAVTGGQASLYRRATIARTEVLRILDGLTPLRVDGDTDDMEAYRTIVRNSVQSLVDELGYPGGPRVAMVDTYLNALTGFAVVDGVDVSLQNGPDDIGGQLGALRERFGLLDVNVNTIEEEGIRTAYWTLVDMVTDLREAWTSQRSRFGGSDGFLGTELIHLSRLMEAASDQVDELEAVLDSVLIPQSERQTILVDDDTNLTLDGLLSWLSAFLSQEGRHLAQDAGRDGIVSGLTPGAVALAQTFKRCVADPILKPKRNGIGFPVRMLPASCCADWPTGMYAARVVIAVASLCRLLVELARRAQAIGRYPGLILLDVAISRLDRAADDGDITTVVNFEVRGHGFRRGLIPAIVDVDYEGYDERSCRIPDFSPDGLLLPYEGTVTGDDESITGLFDLNRLADLIGPATARQVAMSPAGIVVPASAIPLVIIDPETASIIHAPITRTWPRMHPADMPRTWDPEDGQAPARTIPHQEIREIYEIDEDDLPWLDGEAPGPDIKEYSGSGPGFEIDPKLKAGEEKLAKAKAAVVKAEAAYENAPANQKETKQRTLTRAQRNLGVAEGELKAWKAVAEGLSNDGGY